MKKILLFFAMFAFGSLVMAQEVNKKKVPSEVKSKFSTLYPGIEVDKWKREGADYQAAFKMDKRDLFASFTSAGDLKYTKVKINTDDLLPAIKEYAQKNFPNQKIDEATNYTLENGKANYSIRLKNTELFFDADGNFLRSQ